MKKQVKRGLAFYKRSGECWTQEDFEKICEYTGNDPLHNKFTGSSDKYIYDNGRQKDVNFMWDWVPDSKLNNCKKVAFEDIFNKKSTKPKQEKKMKQGTYFRANYPKSNKINTLGLLYQANKFGLVDPRPFVLEEIKKCIEENMPSNVHSTDLYNKALADYDLQLASFAKLMVEVTKLPKEELTLELQIAATVANIEANAHVAKLEKTKNKPDHSWIQDYLTLDNMNSHKAINLFTSNKLGIYIENAILYFNSEKTEASFPIKFNKEENKFHL